MNIFENLKHSLNMKYNPVGVKLIFEQSNIEIDSKFKEITKRKRYCEFVKDAANGEFYILKKGDFSCVIGEIMIGLKAPETIELDKRLTFKGLKSVLLFPINEFLIEDIDCIILIVTPSSCMDIVEAYIKVYEKPLKVDLGAYSGVCSDITAMVIKREDVNFSFLCSGSRIFAQYDDCYLLCGIPGKMCPELIKELEHLSIDRKADYELIKQLYNLKEE
jgi:uncharacterized protein (DUF169 family)